MPNIKKKKSIDKNIIDTVQYYIRDENSFFKEEVCARQREEYMVNKETLNKIKFKKGM